MDFSAFLEQNDRADEPSDMCRSTVEVRIILASQNGDNRALVAQIRAYTNHLRMLFGDV